MVNKKTLSVTTLSGDIGGSKTRLQLTHFSKNEKLAIVAKAEYENHQFLRFTDIVNDFLKTQSTTIDAACFALAGPIANGTVQLTNLPWHLSENELKTSLKIQSVKFINDFEAIGYGAPILENEDYFTLQNSSPQKNALQAIIGAGTGLGVALIYHDEQRTHVLPTEGGHVDFAPSDTLQENLLLFLRKKFHRVSNERIVSGKGIENIYRYLVSTSEYRERENEELKHLSHFSNDFAADISRFATEHHDPIALHTLDTFVRCYGAITGNLALTTLPFGGLYIAGGIAPKLLPQLQDGRFMQAFLDKGRMSELLRNVPIKIILNTSVGLIGAAYYAAHLVY